MMKVGVIQITATDDPAENLGPVTAAISEAAAQGAQFVLTPEVTNCISLDRARQNAVLELEEDDLTLSAFRDHAKGLGIWVLIGSLGIKTGDPDGRFANRSFLVGPDGQIAARYDKIHMFDVQISKTESFKESNGYRPGNQAVLAKTDFGTVGLTICYDLRFPALHRALALAGAEIITVPAAFSPVTGEAHWEVLLRARAIETGCFVIAPAQTGDHGSRKTYGHSMIVSPWGEVLLDMGEAPGVAVVDIDLDHVKKARSRVPSLTHDRPFDLLR